MVEVTYGSDFDQDAIDELLRALTQFARAIERGMFAPARLLRAALVTEAAGSMQLAAQVSDLPQSVLTVLAGMLHHIHGVFGPLAAFRAWMAEAPGPDLLAQRVALPQLPDPLPAGITVEIDSQHITPPLEVSIEFSAPVVDAGQREALYADLQTWAGLLQGGYAWEDAPLGESALVEPTVRFDSSQTLRFVTEQWLGSPSGFVPLMSLLHHVAQRHPISSVEILAD